MEDIAFEPLTKDCTEKAIIMLRNNFFFDEPLNKAVALCKRGQPHKELEEFCLDVINQEMSFLATVKETGEIVGVALNGVEDGDKTNEKKLYKDQKLQKIFDFLGSVDKDVEWLNKFNKSCILELKILSVDSNFRGKGIAAQLFKVSEAFACDRGYHLLRSDCTSLFSQKLFTHYGFTMLKEIVYDEYPTKEARLFNVEAPHVSFKLMVKVLKEPEKNT